MSEKSWFTAAKALERTAPLELSVSQVTEYVDLFCAPSNFGYDDEMAHCYEDSLYRVVLRATAAGHPEAKALAAQAIRVSDLEFSRWYA